MQTPTDGQAIRVNNGQLQVPDNPIIPYIEGERHRPRHLEGFPCASSTRPFEKAYGGQRRIVWYEIFAGEKSYKRFNEWYRKGTLDAIQHFVIAIKGPLTTPVGGWDPLAQCLAPSNSQPLCVRSTGPLLQRRAGAR
jgi:isocitrate dehydrogenase